MLYFAVTGNPVGHSKSPVLFWGGYPDRKEDFAYFRMTAESAIEANELFRELRLDGMNITAPFKLRKNWTVDGNDEIVTRLGVGNTLVREGERILLCNTDVYGVSGALEAVGMILQNKRCLVLGAGGAGIAAVYALQGKGGQVVLVNRTREKAIHISRLFGCEAGGLERLDEEVSRADVIVNTLPADVDVVREERLYPGQVLLDAIYTGSILREKAERAGCAYIDGRSWLLYQGIPAYRMFTGWDPDIRGMKKALFAKERRLRHVAFIGFMGAGKSTVAPLVAKLMGKPCVDADRELEIRCGKSIVTIIRENGESYFREKEYQVTKELLEREEPSVIACGGGVVLNAELRELLNEKSRVVWLYARPEICVHRIDVNTRPLLALEKHPVETARRLFEERKAYYARTAWLLVSGNCRNAEEVSRLIYEEISKSDGNPR